MNTLAVVDIDKKIRYQHLGWVGAAQDQRVYATSKV